MFWFCSEKEKIKGRVWGQERKREEEGETLERPGPASSRNAFSDTFIYSLMCSFIKYLLSIPGSVPGGRDKVINMIDMAPVFMKPNLMGKTYF